MNACEALNILDVLQQQISDDYFSKISKGEAVKPEAKSQIDALEYAIDVIREIKWRINDEY